MQEVDWVGLGQEREAFVGAEGHFLQKLVRRDVALERARVVQLADEDAEALRKLGLEPQVLEHEVVPQRGDVGECVHDDIEVIVLLDVIQSDITRDVLPLGEIHALEGLRIEAADIVFGVRRVNDVFYVVERVVEDFVALGEDVDAERRDVDEDVVVGVEGVCVCVGARAATLEVLAADETRVDVDVGEGDGAELFEVCG